MGFTFLQSTFFCYTLLSYHSIIPVAKLFVSILPGLFEPVVYSSPNGLIQPLVLLLHHWRAPVSHLFSLRRPGPACFPWASSVLFLTLHSHGFLLNSLGFLDLITLSLILRAHGLAINPLLSLLSLLWTCRGPLSLFHIIYYLWFAFSLFLGSFKPIYLIKAHLFISWACDSFFLSFGLNGSINLLLSLLSLLWAYCGPFSLFHIIYCPWFTFSLFPDSFKPIYLLKAHLFISWACDPLFLPLWLNGFSIYLPTLFYSCYWASPSHLGFQNGPQHLAP